MTRTALRLLAATVAACLALLLGAAPAFAHTRLESSNPTDKSSVDAAPESVSLTFNEDISAEFATMSVVGPDGTNYQTGQVSAAGGQVSTAVSPLGPAGVYQIGYRVVSDDGHPVQGKVSFTLTTPGPAAAAPTTAPQPRPPRRAGAHGRARRPAGEQHAERRRPDLAVAGRCGHPGGSRRGRRAAAGPPRLSRGREGATYGPDGHPPVRPPDTGAVGGARARHHGGGGRARRRAGEARRSPPCSAPV